MFRQVSTLISIKPDQKVDQLIIFSVYSLRKIPFIYFVASLRCKAGMFEMENRGWGKNTSSMRSAGSTSKLAVGNETCE